jgi:hypothetical protein
VTKAGWIPVVVVVFALVTVPGRAEDNCLVSPNERAPRGSHWKFHDDPIKQRKCWYLRTKDPAMQGRAGGEKPKTPATSKLLSRSASRTAVDQAVPEARSPRPVEAAPAALGGTLTQAKTQDNDPVGHREEANPKIWPDPPTPADTGSVLWPNPPLPRPALTYGDSTESTPKEKANEKQEVLATADPDDVTGNGHAVKPSEKKVARAFPVVVFSIMVSLLVIAGMLLSDVVRKNSARRRMLHPAPQGPIFDVENLDDSVTEALRKLSRVQSGQRKAASA